MDRQLTFEILMYLNIYYFGLYVALQALFFVLKMIYIESYTSMEVLNEFSILFVLCVVESFRLYIGQVEDIGRKISVMFRVLVLTVPSQYMVAYFTFWQHKVTQLDAVMGMIMLVIQFVQLSCAMVACFPNRRHICFNPFDVDFEKMK